MDELPVEVRNVFIEFCERYGLNVDNTMVHGITVIATAAFIAGYNTGINKNVV